MSLVRIFCASALTSVKPSVLDVGLQGVEGVVGADLLEHRRWPGRRR